MQPELSYKKWLRSIIQQGVMMLKKIDDRVDWDERDHELAQMLHRDWYLGEYIILGFDYAAKAREDAQQKTIFDELTDKEPAKEDKTADKSLKSDKVNANDDFAQ